MNKMTCSVCSCPCDEDSSSVCPECDSSICEECTDLYEGHCQDCYQQFNEYSDYFEE